MLAPLPPSIIQPRPLVMGRTPQGDGLAALPAHRQWSFLLFRARMTAYYNEIDPYACDWLENLIWCGLIADGVVDRRSILDVHPSDLAGFTQCHFFAGIGIWSHALRRAGWADDRPVWTGSCPCQPFSAAGKGGGFDDERHLWPAWHHLIDQRNPPVVLGEQVASKDGLGWLDLVLADLEVSGYAVGASDLCAAGLGAPHIRQRLWFVAHSDDARLEGWARAGGADQRAAGPRGVAGGLADDDDAGLSRFAGLRLQGPGLHDADGRGVLGGFWAGADWIPCRDGKWRPVEPVTQPLVDGYPSRMGRVRADHSAALEEEIKHHADACKADPREALFDVWCTLAAETVQRTLGRPRSVQEAPVLLAFLCQLAKQGWPLAEGVPRTGQEAHEAGLRVLRGQEPTPRSPRRRGLDEQQACQLADLVRVLPSVLARHAQAAWGEAFYAHAAATFPLAHGTHARVGRLRAYGNAIVAPVAQTWIEAVMECMP